MIIQVKITPMEKLGVAAAFFNPTVQQRTIARHLPTIFKMAQVPPGISFYLAKTAQVKKFGEFAPLAEESLQYGVNRALIAFSEIMTGKKLAGELLAILNQIYQSPIYKEGQEFLGAVSYIDKKGRLAVKYAAQADKWQFPFEKQ